MSADMQDVPILQGEPVSEENARLVTLFDQIENGQLDFLDQAGKRIIELITALLGVLFAVTAFGDKFPPPYLVGNIFAKAMSIATLALYVLSMGAALLAIQPREYKRYHHNLTAMREELTRIITFKSRWLKVAGALFGLGSAMLAVLIGAIILAA